jgi:hypothetical protein
LKDFNYIFQIDLDTSQRNLIVNNKYLLVQPGFDFDKPFCYFISDENDLKSLVDTITNLFIQSYFRLNNKPVIIFENESLKKSFYELVENKSLGKIESLLKGINSDFIFFIKTLSDFSSIFKSKSVGIKYFISEDNNGFKKWTNSIHEKEKTGITELYKAQKETQELANQVKQLKNELSLATDSLLAVKTEYSKELKWYKKEIDTIKHWYKEEHRKTPALITKLFKKVF